ncbi:WavE lipopolysaccharide synthesis [Butyrivibrio hungatei DSM 14810]|uniref:WavE lipopolysaccharide synthesis n=1 Tax=Butyrivibrio hungatei DSM 14810 TaxID=1121132 RepID=A0A1M7RYT0_9FIRM|nr:WavE lipopolysaccharide synthesis family protein [Butyrivibrio hungatei]SHN51294.1 WavE lipopolysaccharide synthesis [Butyrivibrio hungatei DSM 14810]
MKDLIMDALAKLIEAHKRSKTFICNLEFSTAVEGIKNLLTSSNTLMESLIFYYEHESAAVYKLSDYIDLLKYLLERFESFDIDDADEIEFLYDQGIEMLETSLTVIKRTERIHDDGEFLTKVYRPKKADEIGIRSHNSAKYKTAIVLQGPIKKEDDFTYESVKLYKVLYPECEIIVSTWKSEGDQKERFESLGAIVLLNDPPEKPGYANCAYQTVSSIEGIRKARELGCVRVCKTRTDQRFHTPNLFFYMEKLLDQFPIKINTTQKKRLIAISTTTLSFRVYNTCDMFIYGEIDDVENYFDCPLDTRDWGKDSNVEWVNAEQFGRLRFAEAWFVSYYLEKLGFKLKFTLEDSDYYRNELFIIVDGSTIDLLWQKYNDDEYKDREYNSSGYDHGGGIGRVSFLEWLSCQ